MKSPIYAIFDSKGGRYSPPFVDINDATALRGFAEAINNNEHFRYSPADYALYNLGDFDNESGKIVVNEPITFMCNGASVINEK